MCVKISVNQAWLSLHAVGDVLTALTGASPHLFTFSLSILPPFSMKRPSLLLSHQTLCFRCPASVSTRPEGSWNEEEGCFVHSFDLINNIRLCFKCFSAVVPSLYCFYLVQCSKSRTVGLKKFVIRYKNARASFICPGLSGSSGQVMITGFSDQCEVRRVCQVHAGETNISCFEHPSVAAKHRSHLAF